MALKITLKPHEKVILGGAVITNGNGSNCDLIVENRIPVLREKDIMTEEQADSPCRRIYFVVQLMYIDSQNLPTHHATYWKLVGDLVRAAPSTTVFIDRISEEIISNRYYRALKLVKELIGYEMEVLDRV